ncbi:MAG: ATP-dependent Clp protease proteolytic subunit [Actinomycetota bacterium]
MGWGSGFVEAAVGDVVDEAADVVLVGDERAVLEPVDALPGVDVRVGEALEGPPRLHPDLGLDIGLEGVLGDGLQAAVGVVDEDDLAGPEEALGEHQRADHVVGDHPAGVADDVGVAVGEAEHLEDVHAAVHAGDDRQVPTGPQREVVVGKLGDVVLVVPEEFLGVGGERCVGHAAQSSQGVSGDGSVSVMSDTIRPMALESGMDPRLDVFNRLLRNRVVMLGTDVNDDIANQICAQLLYLEAEDPNTDIWLYINSPGGSVTAGMAIYDTMQFVSCDIATVCMGMAASMGQFLLTAGAPGKRYTLPNARIMMHQPLAGLRGQATDIAIQAEQLAFTKRRMAEMISQHSGQPLEKIQADSERDRWFTAEEAKAYGLVDHVILRRGEIR